MKWLHISDLHYHPENMTFDTATLLEDLEDYIKDKGIRADVLFYTGDFRFAKEQKEETAAEDAKRAAEQLKKIAGLAGAKEIHIVPGNHDLARGDGKLFETVYDKYVSNDSGSFSGTVNYNGTEVSCSKYLSGRFSFFKYVAEALGDRVWTEDALYGQIHCCRSYPSDKPRYNILYLNTAIASIKDNERGNIAVGYEHIQRALEGIDKSLPTIALGHHALECLTHKEIQRVKNIFKHEGIKIYLCGDEHIGGVNDSGTLLQLTAGCLKQGGRVEPVFYAAEMTDGVLKDVKAYQHFNETYTGWTLYEPLTKKIAERVKIFFPRAEGSIFGREDDISEITELLLPPTGKIAEVWGVAGIGKTTVCSEVLKRIRQNSNWDCLTADARFARSAKDIQREILKKFDVDPEKIMPDDYENILLEEAKRRKNGLLYIDNAETIISEDRAEFSKWLFRFGRQSGWRLMYSTQIQLAANQLKPFEIKPLAPGAAYSLFKSIWGEINSEHEKTAENIIERLSYHPLAIEVAAKAMKWRKCTLGRFAAEIEKRTRHELGDDPEDPHRSMKAALGLTLSEIEKSRVAERAKFIWQIFAQYPGDFSDELFSEAFGNEPEFEEALQILRDLSLVTDGYKMLEPIKAEADGFDESGRKEARVLMFQTLAGIFERGGNRELDDRQKWHELSLDCLQPTLSLLSQSTKDDFAEMKILVHSTLNYFQYSSHTSVDVLDKLEKFYRDERDNPGLASVLMSMGDLESKLGKIESAQGHCKEAESLYWDERDDRNLANALQSMGELESKLGKIESAQGYYKEAESLYQNLLDNLGFANVLWSMGELESELGEIESAQGHYKEAESLYRDERSNLGLANVLRSMGYLESRLGEIESAQGHYKEAEGLYRDLRFNLGLANVLQSMGDLESAKGQEFIHKMIEYYTNALELYEQVHTPMGRAYCFAKLFCAYVSIDDWNNAIKYLEKAESSLNTVPENIASDILELILRVENLLDIEPQSSPQ